MISTSILNYFIPPQSIFQIVRDLKYWKESIITRNYSKNRFKEISQSSIMKLEGNFLKETRLKDSDLLKKNLPY